MLGIANVAQAVYGSGQPAPEVLDGVRTVDVTMARRLRQQGATFIDVRGVRPTEPSIAGAVRLEWRTKFSPVRVRAEASPVGVVIFGQDTFDHVAASAAERASEWLSTPVYYLRSGFASWEDASFDVASRVIGESNAATP